MYLLIILSINTIIDSWFNFFFSDAVYYIAILAPIAIIIIRWILLNTDLFRDIVDKETYNYHLCYGEIAYYSYTPKILHIIVLFLNLIIFWTFIGWLYVIWVVTFLKFEKVIKTKTDYEYWQKKKEKQKLVETRKRLRYLIYKYGEKAGVAVYLKEIWVGMRVKALRDSWGEPLTIKKTITEDNVKEEWFYGHRYYTYKYVYIENGIVTAWKNYSEYSES